MRRSNKSSSIPILIPFFEAFYLKVVVERKEILFLKNRLRSNEEAENRKYEQYRIIIIFSCRFTFS